MKYQVVETECCEYGVFISAELEELGDKAKSIFKSEYAAEAQEKADELNRVEDEWSN